jgi:hypothetical protein
MTERFHARRQTLKYLGMLTGTVVGRQFLAGWLPAGSVPEKSNAHPDCAQRRGSDQRPEDQPDNAAPYVPRFFKPDEFKTVEALTERILPTDDTPGAKEARVARYIDFVVSAASEFQPSLQRVWTQGLSLLDRLSREKYQRAFREIPTGDQEALLMAMSLPEHKPGASHPGFDLYRLVKEMTVEGFYTSRLGLIDVLGYKGLAVLSDFPGCTHPEHQA